jgi:hypothetical protein
MFQDVIGIADWIIHQFYLLNVHAPCLFNQLLCPTLGNAIFTEHYKTNRIPMSFLTQRFRNMCMMLLYALRGRHP